MSFLGVRRRSTAQVLSVLLLSLLPLAPVAPAGVVASAEAATPITVAAARATQDGSTATVRGYVVGQPTASTTVVTSGFPSDYALALADTAGVTDTTQMVYVQVPSAFRSAWGLRSNPSLLGKRIDVTGEVNDSVSNGTAPGHGRLSVLLRWNAEDPPSAFELRRNDVIHADFQGNRNPFIDHPEWATSIWAA